VRSIARLHVFAISLLLALLALPVQSPALSLAPVGSFDQPIFITSDPEDPNRLFVVEREGRVLLVSPSGTSLFGELGSLVSCCSGERGLSSIALAPDFATSNRFYAAYAGTGAAGGAEGDIHVDAFRPGPTGGGELVREPILTIGHADFATHYGSQLHFGPDGHLYISTGDGGGVGDPLENGQDLESLLGKVLRIEPLPGQDPAYASPSDNPFFGGGDDARDEIWAYGLRNPWRFSFDSESGDLVVADVGQGEREEVDHALGPAPGVVGGSGANYGWNCREGLIQYENAPVACDGLIGFTDPVFDHPHDDPGEGKAFGCSITGGFVARDPSLGELFGRYLYADFCIGQIRSLLLPATVGGIATDDRSEGVEVSNPVSFGEDACQRLYVASNAGAVFRLEGDSPSPCTSSAAGGEASVPVSLAGPTAPPRLHLLVRGRRTTRGGASVFTLLVRLAPYGDMAERMAQLNRGGRRYAVKSLNRACEARFHVRVLRTTTFRAVFEGQRSQVRTIALAKPRP
jgi:glucose/sorbosone dehydrogenase